MFYFRVDSNEVISAGHVMRCLTIARALRERGREPVFLSADEGAAGLVKGDGFRCLVLGSDWKNLEAEEDKVSEILRSSESPVLLVDTYSATPGYLTCVGRAAKVCYLGSKRIAAPCLDLLVNYSTNIDRCFYELAYRGSGTRLLLGPAYAPLRWEFRGRFARRPQAVGSVLLTTGNTDTSNMTDAILAALLDALQPNPPKIKVVVGPLFKYGRSLASRYEGYSSVELLNGVSDMADLMSASDIAISACGTTLYELAACGVPTVGFSLVEEQNESGERLAELGVIEYAGHAYSDKDGCVSRIVEGVVDLVENSGKRNVLAERFHSLIDGNGCSRICNELLTLEAEGFGA